MSAVHDLGGRPGFGRIEREAREPVFHARWESRVMGMVYAIRRANWLNLDAFRHGIERMDPARYLAASYYERWLASLERTLPEVGALTPGAAPPPAGPYGFEREVGAPARFAVGSTVRVRARKPVGHTRLPGYASGKRGTVVSVRGGYVFPDTNAHGLGEQPQHLYSVRFSARELWGESAEPRTSVCIDLFEPYLEADPVPSSAEETRDGA
ncbi:MAG TPA: nitrile hydratase subunit beta [Myxococcota bacterium]|nr:nitrile hydratase subunit beta [Myxococcota bacterium]